MHFVRYWFSVIIDRCIAMDPDLHSPLSDEQMNDWNEFHEYVVKLNQIAIDPPMPTPVSVPALDLPAAFPVSFVNLLPFVSIFYPQA